MATYAVLTEKLAAFPELNPNNFDEEDVRLLNKWGVDLVLIGINHISVEKLLAIKRAAETMVEVNQEWNQIAEAGDAMQQPIAGKLANKEKE